MQTEDLRGQRQHWFSRLSVCRVPRGGIFATQGFIFSFGAQNISLGVYSLMNFWVNNLEKNKIVNCQIIKNHFPPPQNIPQCYNQREQNIYQRGIYQKKSVKRPFCCIVSILQVYFTYLCYITFWALEYHFIENLKLLLKENQIMKQAGFIINQ